MTKPKLLYASPFPPMKSGISDYSEILVDGLNRYFDITLLIDNYRLSNKKLYMDYEVKIFGKNKINFNNYEYKIYNIGNNPHFHSYIYACAIKYPGLVIMHDFSIYYLVVGYYQNKENFFSKIYEISGSEGLYHIKKVIKRKEDLLNVKHLSSQLPLNKEILLKSNKIMVHSLYSFNKIKDIVTNLNKVKKINMVEHLDNSFNFISKKRLYKRFNIPLDKFILASFGFIDHTKLNHLVCKTVKELNKTYDNIFVYVMVGEGHYVDSYLGDSIIKTGYVNIEEFNSFIFHCDLAFNLRYPSMGETSASLIRIMGAGKPCIVSDDAWFSELPNNVVYKIKNENAEEEILKLLEKFINNQKDFLKVGENAKKYIKENHSIDKISKDIYEFLVQ